VKAEPGFWPSRETHTMVVLVGGINKGVLQGLQYAKSLNPDRLVALSVVSSPEEQAQLQEQWDSYNIPLELTFEFSEFRELTKPVMRFLDELDSLYSDDIITVVIPEFVTSWKTQWLHNGSAFALKARLLHRPHTAVVSVPVHMHQGVIEEG